MKDPFHALESSSDWEAARAASEETPVLIFKHSSACSVSARAHDEMATLATETDLPVYKVVVQEARPVSNAIEAALDVRHETPQAILLRDGRPTFHTSHFDVTAETLRDELPNPSVSSD